MHSRPLRESEADPDPLVQFRRWFEEAAAVPGVRLPEAMALATATTDGIPSVRMVLMKGFGPEGFRFFTNHDSRKGSELAANPRAALLFYWDPLGRQVRIEGPVSRLDEDATGAYVRSRPRASQLSALASPQSHPVASREELERRVAELDEALGAREPPVPAFWGGYLLAPVSYEFWQNRDDRLHDRLLYTQREAGGWQIQRLAP